MSSQDRPKLTPAEIRRILRDFEASRRARVGLTAGGALVVAVLLIALMDQFGYLFGSSSVGTAAKKILEAALDGFMSAIIIYYLIDNRLSKIRVDMEEKIRLIGNAEIFSAVFNINVDTEIAKAWKKSITSQKLSVQHSKLDIYFTRRQKGTFVRFDLTEEIIALDRTDQKKSVTLGPGGNDIWGLSLLDIDNRTHHEYSRRKKRNDSKELTEYPYTLQACEGDKIVRVIKCDRVFPHAVVDNQVFGDGTQKLSLRFFIDENFHRDQDYEKPPIELSLPVKVEENDWTGPVKEGPSEAGGVSYMIYSCNPKCVFLPHQGFTYRLAEKNV